jgi:hypothetical protein
VGVTSLHTFGNNTNSVVSAETLMMLKERVTESFGPIRYTMSNGVSGGAMQQHLITNAYPGLLDGIMPGLSFADLYKNNREVQDCGLALHYMKDTNPALWPDVNQRNRVFGTADLLPGTCEAWKSSNLPEVWGNPRVGCVQGSLTIQSFMYDPSTNPTGTRCTIQDYQKVMFGTRASDGFANTEYDNVGVQFGLNALNASQISKAQFLDLNEKVGGIDVDKNYIPTRSVADQAGLDNLFRTGQLNMGTGMDTVPIIDDRSCMNTEVHSCYHSWVMRERLIKTHGDADNQVIIVNAPAGVVFDMMDRWLTGIEADSSSKSQAEKVVANKPSDAKDACYINSQRVLNQTVCRTNYPIFGNVHLVAGDNDIADDVMKCQLRTPQKSDYAVTFSDVEWTKLQSIFTTGVCDWSKPSVGFQPAVPWLSFATGVGGNPIQTATLTASGSGRTVTLTGGGTPGNGTVEFREGNTSLGVMPVGAGQQATKVLSNVSPGSHSYTAVYTPDDSEEPASTSSPKSVSISKVASATKLTAPGKAKRGSQPMITVGVGGASDQATGTVVVTLNGAVVATLALVDGKASTSLPKLKTGTAQVAVTYSGDDTYQPSSASASIKVKKKKHKHH